MLWWWLLGDALMECPELVQTLSTATSTRCQHHGIPSTTQYPMALTTLLSGLHCALGKRETEAAQETHQHTMSNMHLGLRLTSRGPACTKLSTGLCSCLQPLGSPLMLSPRGSAPPTAALHGSQCQPGVPWLHSHRTAWQVINGSLPAAGKALWWGPFLYPPNPPVSAFLQGWHISPGTAWHRKMLKRPGRGELPVPGAQCSRAPGPGVQPGTQPGGYWCWVHTQVPGPGIPTLAAFGFFQQHQNPLFHLPGLQIVSMLLQIVTQ